MLSNTIGYKLQEGISQLTQIAIATYGTENISEWATSWSLLLQYGLADLQQLDLFERGASDRLAVLGISRYLNENNISERGFPLIRLLRFTSEQLTQYLKADNRVPQLSIDRIMDELGL